MVISLTSRIKQLIIQLEKYPDDSMDIDIAVPYHLLQKINRYFIEEASNVREGDRIIRNELESNRVEDVIRRTLYKLLSVGITYSTNPSIVEESIQYALKYIVHNYPVHLAWSPVNMGIPYPNKLIQELDSRIGLTRLDITSPWEELHYGMENSLFFWSGQSWRITPLGVFFKSLSLPSGTVFLLMLENYLNVPERKTPFNANPWHISKQFLEAFLKKGKSQVDIGDGKYDFIEYDPNMYLLNRLGQFQLTNTVDLTEQNRSMPDEIDGIRVLHIADEFYEISLTSYGKEIVRRVVDESPNILRSMIENLVTFELSSKQYYETTTDEAIGIMTESVRLNKAIVGDQLEPLLEITKALQIKRLDILTLRALPPTIERILKNILIETKTLDKSNSTITLGGIIAKFDGLISSGGVVIQYDTLQYIKSIDRNSLLHGSVSPNGGIREALINLMVNVLIKIFEDYSKWKILQRAT
jgi:hypothetical protein